MLTYYYSLKYKISLSSATFVAWVFFRLPPSLLHRAAEYPIFCTLKYAEVLSQRASMFPDRIKSHQSSYFLSGAKKEKMEDL